MSFFGQKNTSNTGTAPPQQGGFLGAKPPLGGSIFGTTNSQPSGGGPFGGTTSNNAPGSTGLFGNVNSPMGNQTGGTSSPFSLPKPAEQSSSQQPAASSFFSQPSSISGTSSTAPSSLFGQKPATSTPTTTSSSSPAPGGGLFGGGNVFGKTTPGTAPAAASTTPASSSTATFNVPAKDAPTTTPGSMPWNLGGKPTETKSPTAGTPGGFNLFGAAKADEKKDEPKGTSPFNLGTTTSKEGDKSSGKSSPKPDAPSPVAVAPPSMLRGKTIEEIVNRWSSELETHAKEFNKFAGEVAVWDRALIENSKNIAALHSHVSAAEREQNDINQSLDHIEQQQKDLSHTLDAYEKITQEILGAQGAGPRALDTGPADTERDKNYMLATDLHTQLDDLSGSLSELIDSVNTLSLGDSASGDDPLSQIAQILSSHLESLQWIDGAIREVEGKVGDVENRIKDSGLSLSVGLTATKSRGFGVNR